MSSEPLPPEKITLVDTPLAQQKFETDPLLTVEEVATYLRVKPATVRAMARQGALPAVKVGRGWRFRQQALQEFIHK